MLFFGIKIITTKHEIMLHNAAKGRIKDVDELRSRIPTAWDELDQLVIDTTDRQYWRTRLRACF